MFQPFLAGEHRRIAHLPPCLIDAEGALAGHQGHREATRHAGPLDEKRVALVKLGIAVGMRHEGAVHAHARKALRAGCSPEEIRHAVVLATTTLGFPGMMAAYSRVDDVLETEGTQR